MALTQDEVLQILKLIEEAPFGELHLEMGGMKLEFRKGVGIAGNQQSGEVAVTEPVVPEKSPIEAEAPEERQSNSSEAGTPEAAEGLLTIKAPVLGNFYRRPEPGAPPYVEVGSLVDENTTVGLIEVMKLFNPVIAGVRGRIQKIYADNGQLVEYGQPLFSVKPAEGEGAQDV